MASPAWLTPEMQPSTPRATVPGLPAVVSSGGPSTPTPTVAAPAPGASTPTSKGSISTSSGSVQGPAQARFASAPGYVVPAPSFSYNVFPNATTPSGSSQQSSSTSVGANLYCLSDFWMDFLYYLSLILINL
jgi:hypothetical protein